MVRLSMKRMDYIVYTFAYKKVCRNSVKERDGKK